MTKESVSWNDVADASEDVEEQARYAMQLPVELTDDELAAKAREMADLCGEIETIEERKKNIAADLNAQIKALRSDLDVLAHDVRRGAVEMSVDVVDVVDWKRNVRRIRRLDTGTTVSEQALTAADRQRSLEVVPDPVEEPPRLPYEDADDDQF